MATMYVERCRRRTSGSDVIEPWFLLSRSAYQRILDVALADMTSAEVLQCACSSTSRGSELLRLLSAGDDVMKPNSDNTGACDMRARSPVSEHGADVENCLPVSLVATSDDRLADLSVRQSSIQRASADDSSEPLCLRRSSVAIESDGRRRQVVESRRQTTATPFHVDQQHTDDDASPPPTRPHPVEENKCSASKQKSSKDLMRKRKSKSDPEVVRVDSKDGDGWAPIDKDILVGIVERLSVSCLQPSPTSSSSSSRVQSVTSRSEFRQPRSLTDAQHRLTRTLGGDVALTRAQPLMTSSSRWSYVAPPHKTRRLRTPPSPMTHGAGRRKTGLHRRVQVRDTWNVPADKTVKSVGVPVSAGAAPRHVWAPLEKSVVLSVIDQILIDVDDETTDESTSAYRRRDLPSRRRWLQPSTLRAITPQTTTTTSDHHQPAAAATEASFKWKSNILRRMRKEQTIVAASSGHWLDTVPGAVAATGS